MSAPIRLDRAPPSILVPILSLALSLVLPAPARAAAGGDEPLSGSAAERRAFAVAARHAPILHQLTGSYPRADAIARFDFDGDWSGLGNWRNADAYGLPAYVYYSVAETQTHYFLVYGVFHPRDYARICLPVHCHENDFEGLGVVVRKDADGGTRAIYLETKAHSGMESVPWPRLDRGPADPGDQPPSRPIAWIEAGGHGVHPGPGDAPDRTLVYAYAGRADDPRGASAGEFGYALLPIETTLWARREEIGEDRTFLETFMHQGARFALGPVPHRFAGRRWATGRANPPWAWADGGRGELARGDWFFDPAYAMARRMPVVPAPYSLKYVSNPFLGIR